MLMARNFRLNGSERYLQTEAESFTGNGLCGIENFCQNLLLSIIKSFHISKILIFSFIIINPSKNTIQKLRGMPQRKICMKTGIPLYWRYQMTQEDCDE